MNSACIKQEDEIISQFYRNRFALGKTRVDLPQHQSIQHVNDKSTSASSNQPQIVNDSSTQQCQDGHEILSLQPRSVCESSGAKAPSIVLLARQSRSKFVNRGRSLRDSSSNFPPPLSVERFAHSAIESTMYGKSLPPTASSKNNGVRKAITTHENPKKMTQKREGVQRPRHFSASPPLPLEPATTSTPSPPLPFRPATTSAPKMEAAPDFLPKWLKEHHKEMLKRNTLRNEDGATVDWIIDKRYIHNYVDSIAESAMREKLSVNESDPLCEPAPEIRPVWTGSGVPILGNGGGARNSDFFFHRGFWKRSKGDVDGAIQVEEHIYAHV
jgi:hypothetical protein